MKRMLALALAFLLLLGMTGCAPKEEQPATEPAPTQSAAEQEVLRLLVIGNSHSNDAFWQLYEVFKAEAPEQQVMIGVLYYSGCPMVKHVQFANTASKVYDYYRNSTGVWEHFAESDMRTALRDQAWDIILFQPGRENKEYEKSTRDALAAYVAEYVKEPYDIYLHKSWPSPNDEELWSETHDPQPPAGLRDTLTSLYGFDPMSQWKIMNEKVTKMLSEDDMFTKQISNAAAIMHAYAASGVPQTELWRDYTHLTDYGRLIAAYNLFATIMDREITEVKVQSIPAEIRHRRAKVLGDMEVTDDMRQVIIDAVKYAQEHPWEVCSAS